MTCSRAMGWGWGAVLFCAVATGGCYSASGGDGNGDEPGGDEGVREGLGDGEIPGATASREGYADGAMSTAAGGAGGGAAPAPEGEYMMDEGVTLDGGGSSSTPEESADYDPVPPLVDGSGIENGYTGAGILTVGAWDDNRNFDRFTEFRAELLQSSLSGVPGFSDEEHAAANDVFCGDREPNQTLDVSLVIDVTGSMGDELSYLQTEFLAISQAIEKKYPDAEQRWSLVVYRDVTDEYKVRWFDFRSDADDFRARLAEQVANGGGDYPEASDAAMEVMNQLAWRKGEGAARLAFWVGDAPHHEENAEAVAEAVRGAQSLDVHIYPVASSGVDELTELTMRSAAQLTGGRYLFLTDDSGVGGAHMEPSIPCYFVTKLDDAILRMVDIEFTGEYREPDPDEVIRTGGDPQDGACTLESGEQLVAF
jgi:hypothetical protein